MNFLIDANIPRSTKAIIESLGHNVVDVRDILPPASSDSDIASFALTENRVIITVTMTLVTSFYTRPKNIGNFWKTLNNPKKH